MWLFFKCVSLVSDFTGSSILKVASLCMISMVENYTLLKKLAFIIKTTTTKTVTLLFAYKKNWSPFSAVKKIIVYQNKNWLLLTTKIVFDKKSKRLVLRC